jgi:hypothetical protein
MIKRIVTAVALLLFIQAEAQAKPRIITSTMGAVMGEQRPPDADSAGSSASGDASATTPGGSVTSGSAAPRRQPRRMSEGEIQGAGCFASGATATVVTYATSPVELALVIAGGSFAPTTPVILALAVTGTISLAACGMGAILAPVAVYAYDEADAISFYLQDSFSSILTRFMPPESPEQPTDP